MKKNYNEQENEELYNKESEEKDIPFAEDEEMIQEIDYEKRRIPSGTVSCF